MERGQPRPEPPPGVTQQQTASSKPNRLSRSYRATQTPTQTQTPTRAEPPSSRQPDFKTPTRTSRPRSAVFRSESPHNDSDLQQDIIWDATSPSPHRLGKRGRRPRAHAVDISEIVKRIAPKCGRPEAAESSIQQWIGDSVPCTPDVPASKPRKSPRLSGVNDLLKLAKQFDFMFHHDEEEAEEQRAGLAPQDAFRPGTDAAEADTWADEDLDSLFEGPTQYVSGALSPAPSPAKPPSLRSSAADVKAAPPDGGLEDDWGDDDLLNDSLFLEMTQNPPKFTSPKFCSTQKPSGCEEAGWTRPVTAALQEPARRGSSAVPRAESNQNSPGSSSDPVWDDPADDQLLCELCEDLENQIQEGRLTPTRRTDGRQGVLQPANRNLLPPASKVPAAVTGENWFQSSRTSPHGHLAFKKPVDPVTFGGGAGSKAARCSAAQIEQKKQQAIERRQRRLAQNPGLPP